MPVPADGGDGSEDDPLAQLKRDIRAGRGKALLVETTASGWGEGRGAAPLGDWQARRLGPNPAQHSIPTLERATALILGAAGCPPGLFEPRADGTAQREALRRWHLGTVLPLARLLETELSEKLEADVRLTFDNYPLDLAGRAQAFQKLVAGGMSVTEALATSGLLGNE